MLCLTFWRKLTKQARSSLELIYSWQYLSPSFRVLKIRGLIFLMSFAYSANNFSSENFLTTSSVSEYYFLYYYLASLMKNGCSLLGRSSYKGFSFFSLFIVVKSFFIYRYSWWTLENLLQFLYCNSAGSKMKLLTLLVSSSFISFSVIFDLLAISWMVSSGTVLVPRLMLFILSNSSKQSTTVSSTFSIPSMSTKTPILSELICSLVTRLEMFSATPAKVLFNIFLSSLYMQMHMASSNPQTLFISVKILSWLLSFNCQNFESETIGQMSWRLYLLLSMDYLTAILRPAGNDVGFNFDPLTPISVLQVLSWISMGLRNPRCVISSSLILEQARLISASPSLLINQIELYLDDFQVQLGFIQRQTCRLSPTKNNRKNENFAQYYFQYGQKINGIQMRLFNNIQVENLYQSSKQQQIFCLNVITFILYPQNISILYENTIYYLIWYTNVVLSTASAYYLMHLVATDRFTPIMVTSFSSFAFTISLYLLIHTVILEITQSINAISLKNTIQCLRNIINNCILYSIVIAGLLCQQNYKKLYTPRQTLQILQLFVWGRIIFSFGYLVGTWIGVQSLRSYGFGVCIGSLSCLIASIVNFDFIELFK